MAAVRFDQQLISLPKQNPLIWIQEGQFGAAA